MASDDFKLRFGPLGPGSVHVCVDMQRLFAEDIDWQTPWMERVLPNVRRLVEADPARTIFTRLGAVDRGYRVVLAADALCSSSDETHDASRAPYRQRYGQQVETVATALVVENWTV